ncbi:MAG: hypothetical protein RL227_1722 [Pseudomonadota bacterium]|jgi:hypothetical protein
MHIESTTRGSASMPRQFTVGPLQASRPRKWRVVSLALAAAAMHAPVWALEYTWLGGDGHFEDAARWSIFGTPGSNDTARIPANTGTGLVQLSSTRPLGRLWMDGGSFGGRGTLQADTLRWDFGRIGVSTSTGGGRLTVAGRAVFNGAGSIILGYSHTLDLGGGALWSIGNGFLGVHSAYSMGSESFPGAQINIAPGTIFTDAGAFDSSSLRTLGGGDGGGSGRTNNAGTYSREGLGETLARNFHNSGTLNVSSGAFVFAADTSPRGSSTGTINVAPGAIVWLGEVDIAGGSVNNQGLVAAWRGRSTVSSGATIGGDWQVASTGFVRFEGEHSVASLVMPSGTITGPGHLRTSRLDLGFARIGDSSAQAGGTVTVSGPTRFDGNTSQAITYSHRLNLRGDATWSVGNGSIGIDSAYLQGGEAFPAAVLEIGAGTTFTDAGTAAASSVRRLGAGGVIENHGTYRREGLGGTEALNLRNSGVLEVAGGALFVDDRFVNTGRVHVAAGTWLVGALNGFRNDGVMEGTGTLQTWSSNQALLNAGTLSPGVDQGIGTLTVLGDLTMTQGATLRIELGATGLSDRVVVTDQAFWDGTLALVAGSGFAPAEGDVFTVASFAQRLSDSTFNTLSWSGPDGLVFAVDYGHTDITVRVTAVPEPAAWLLMAAGLAVLLPRARRVPRAGQSQPSPRA